VKPLHLDLIGAEIVFNNLYDTVSPDWLDEDLAFVRLPDGTKVEVGWYGEPGNGGFFKIVLFETSWSKPLETIRTGNLHDVIQAMQRLNLNACVRAMIPKERSNSMMTSYQSVVVETPSTTSRTLLVA
jgi:hypothetical protein